jgi:hypothetical protein
VWSCPTEAKVFNPNIGKLDSKTVSCHFIGYPERSKGYRFYYPDRHTKIVETRHAVFLEDNMIRGSMVAREISLQEKRVHVPTLMVEEPFFTLSVVVAPTVQDTIVPTPMTSSLVVIINEHEEPVLEKPILEEPIEPNVAHEEEQQQLNVEQVAEALEGLKEQEGQLFLITMKFMKQKNFRWGMIPPNLKKSCETITHQSGLRPWKMK